MSMAADGTEPASEEKCQGGQAEKVPNRRTKLFARLLPLLMAILYVVGLIWHLSHPFVSVFTGQLRARGLYVDESSMDPSHLRAPHPYPLIKKTKDDQKLVSDGLLCTATEKIWKSNWLVSCHNPPFDSNFSDSNNEKKPAFQVLQILPRQAAVIPTHEALVLVIPCLQHLESDQFQASILHLIDRLADSTWLSKTLFVVSPSSTSVSLSQALDDFLELYQGRSTTSGSLSPPSLWPREVVTNAIVRTVLVLASAESSSDDDSVNELRILPQGRNGGLPNMDLVSTASSVYSRARFMRNVKQQPGLNKSSLTVHPYGTIVRDWTKTLASYLPPKYHQYLEPVLDLLAFEASLLPGGEAPHATALSRHTDGLTIQAALHHPKDVSEAAAMMEPLVRAVSNLHERLHHSTSLYLLPNARQFIKHEEYLVPNLLLVIPMLIRAAWTLLTERISLSTMFSVIAVCALATVAVALLEALVQDMMKSNHGHKQFISLLLVTLVTGVLRQLWSSYRKASPSTQTIDRLSCHVTTCLFGAYVHAGLAFGHVSLAFPSALFWAPLLLLAGPSQSKVFRVVQVLVLLVSSCGLALLTATRVVPGRYLFYAYIPLHFLLATNLFL